MLIRQWKLFIMHAQHRCINTITTMFDLTRMNNNNVAPAFHNLVSNKNQTNKLPILKLKFTLIYS